MSTIEVEHLRKLLKESNDKNEKLINDFNILKNQLTDVTEELSKEKAKVSNILNYIKNVVGSDVITNILKIIESNTNV